VSNGCCIGLFGWEIPAVKKEPTAHQYHRKARECEMNAEKTTNAADRHAWQDLAEDWLRERLRSTLLWTWTVHGFDAEPLDAGRSPLTHISSAVLNSFCQFAGLR
jgi:hypothetical protein